MFYLPLHVEMYTQSFVLRLTHTHFLISWYVYMLAQVCFRVFSMGILESYLCAGLVLSLRARAALALHLSARRHFIDIQRVHAGCWGTRRVYTGALGGSFLLADCAHWACPSVLSSAAGRSGRRPPQRGGGERRGGGGRRGRSLTCRFIHAQGGLLQLRGNVSQGDVGGCRAGAAAVAPYGVGWGCPGTATGTSCWGVKSLNTAQTEVEMNSRWTTF